MRRTAAIIDVVAVMAFVIIGRDAHHHGETVHGIASTAWPFLAGLAVGWAISLRPPASFGDRPGLTLRRGIAPWSATVVVGMTLRVVAGQGTAVAFILVALAFLGVTMLGGRLLAGVIVRSRAMSTVR